MAGQAGQWYYHFSEVVASLNFKPTGQQWLPQRQPLL